MGPPRCSLKKVAAAKQGANSSDGKPLAETGKQLMKKARPRTVFEGFVGQEAIAAKPLNALAPPSAAASSSQLGEKKKVATPPPSPPSAKKQKISEGDLHWSEIFTDCEGENEVCSLWDTRLNVRELVSKHVLTGDDRARIESAGLEHACLALQSMTLKAAAIGNVINEEVNKLRLQERQSEKDSKQFRKTASDYASLSIEYKLLQEKMVAQEKAKKECEEFVTNQLSALEVEWKKKIGVVHEQVKTQEEKNVELEAPVADLKRRLTKDNDELGETYFNGFDGAKDQILCFHPELDLSRLDVCKVVVNGELVDLPDSDDEVTEVQVQEGETKEVGEGEA